MSAVDRHLPIVKTLACPTEEATQALAQALAQQPDIGHAFIALHGNLGAGKTTLVRHLLRALGVTGRVKSPTYAVVEPYELADLNIWHFDFYRFADPQEWEDAGFRDIFASPGLKLAEWPEKAGGKLPLADLDITLATDSATPSMTARKVTLCANTATGLALLDGAAATGLAA